MLQLSLWRAKPNGWAKQTQPISITFYLSDKDPSGIDGCKLKRRKLWEFQKSTPGFVSLILKGV
jgi:hypothetical protein